ncbi:MAG: hypothetical protein ABMA64_37500 [Myxococcota bacterium]
MIGVILCAAASAQDKGDEVIVRTIEEYEGLLDLLDSKEPARCDWCEFAPGTTEIRSQAVAGVAGTVLTRTELSSWPWGAITEDWYLDGAEQVLRAGADLKYTTTPYYPTGKTGGAWLHYAFAYMPPPSPDSVGRLPSALPWFTSEVHEFAVYTVVGGSETLTGALYRDVELDWVGGDPLWRDVWVLYSNYRFPTLTNGVTTRLVLQNTPDRTLRAFLQAQPTTSHLFVQASTYIEPL